MLLPCSSLHPRGGHMQREMLWGIHTHACKVAKGAGCSRMAGRIGKAPFAFLPRKVRGGTVGSSCDTKKWSRHSGTMWGKVTAPECWARSLMTSQSHKPSPSCLASGLYHLVEFSVPCSSKHSNWYSPLSVFLTSFGQSQSLFTPISLITLKSSHLSHPSASVLGHCYLITADREGSAHSSAATSIFPGEIGSMVESLQT